MTIRQRVASRPLKCVAIGAFAVFAVMVKGGYSGLPTGVPAAEAAQSLGAQSPRVLELEPQKLTGDFDAMLERRSIRVAVPLSRTLYFNDHGREHGFTADNVRLFERHVNRKYSKKLGKRPLTVLIGTLPRDKLLQYVVDGRADIAAGNLTVTEARRKLVDFVVPSDSHSYTEIVLTGPGVAPLASAEDLAGRTVHVRQSSSYYESLVTLNERFKKAGKRPVNMVLVPDVLEDEDMMEMLNAGLLQAMVCDDWKARIWAQMLPKINLNKGAVVREGGVVGWAIRKNSPQLTAVLKEFGKQIKPGILAASFKKYYRRIEQIHNNATASDRKRFENTISLFEKYGAKYGFDPLLLAAQGYQESRLRQDARSPGGAIGIMQVLPKTGASLEVGDITRTEPNIHAGAKYLDRLMQRYFADAKFDEQNRTLFAFAAYNAGPARIAQMRELAVKRGLDPQQWFNNVEIVSSERIGMTPTTYVRNIYKYYVAYRFMEQVRERRQKARKALQDKR